MADRQVRVTFEPSGRAVFVLPNTTIIEAAACAGLTINTPCGETGSCSQCSIRVIQGTCEPTASDRQMLGEDELQDGWRLACQTAVRDALVVYVPDRSLFASQHQILSATRTETVRDIRPAVSKVYVEMPAPTLMDCDADMRRLEQRVGAYHTDLALLRRLPGILRQQDFQGTAVLCDQCLIDFEPGDTSSQNYGMAFDIGTTTIVGCLLSLPSGEELAVVSRMNPQVKFGDDVLSRIKYADSDPNGLNNLSHAVVAEIAQMIDQVCTESSIHRAQIYTMALAGNTTMQQLLCGIDCRPLGQVPFAPACNRGLRIPAGQLEIPIHDRATAYVFPVIGGFIGGDTVAGILSTQLASQVEPTLMVDLGTNGEIVLAHDGELWATSTAAGPAFEGARISCGMRATQGAIEKVTFDGDFQFSVLGDGPPSGLCGSGLIDISAELLRHGVISPEGRMLPPEELPPALSTALQRRVERGRTGKIQFRLVERGTRGAERPIVLTQRDVRELQLASGAIRAGIRMLLKHAGLQPAELKSVLLAGGFGSFIRRHNAQQIGLLPADLDPRSVHFVGNTSLAGAKWVVLSTEAREQAEQLAQRTRQVQLSTDSDFQREFAEAMIFPTHAPQDPKAEDIR